MWDLAGQLLYGDSMQCSNFVSTSTLTCAEKFDRRADSDGVQHANCPAKSYYSPATREAGLVQIYSAVSTVLGRQSSACRRFWSEHCGYGDLC